MKLRSFLFIVSFVICCNAEGQNKKVLENQMNDVKYEFFSNYFKIHNVTGHLTSSVLTSFDQCNQ